MPLPRNRRPLETSRGIHSKSFTPSSGLGNTQCCQERPELVARRGFFGCSIVMGNPKPPESTCRRAQETLSAEANSATPFALYGSSSRDPVLAKVRLRGTGMITNVLLRPELKGPPSYRGTGWSPSRLPIRASVQLMLLLLASGAAAGQELLQDGNLEASRPDGTFPSSGFWQPAWLGQAGIICVSGGRTNSNCLFLYTGKPTNDFWAAPYQDVVAAPGHAFRGSAWIRIPPNQPWVAGTRARVHVAFLTAATNVLTSWESPALTQFSTQWLNYSVTTEPAPPKTAFVRFMCLLEKPRGMTGISVAVFDDCSLQETGVQGLEVSSRAVGIPAEATNVLFTIRNTGNLPLTWHIDTAPSWLSVLPAQGNLATNTTQTLSFRANRSGLSGTNCVQGSLDLVWDAGRLPIQIYLDLPSPSVPSAPALVRTYGRQLVVRDRLSDGALAPPLHYAIKGVAWSPSSRDTPDIFSVRRTEFVNWYVTDIQQLRAMNANTVYTFLDFGTNAAAFRVLDNLYKNGLKAIVTVDENGTGNTNKLVEVVTAYRNHPAILGWCIGNEWNINSYHGLFPPPPEGYYAAAAFTESLARMVKALDANHPVISTHGDIYPPEMNTLANQLCPSVDIWGLNVYRGPSFTTLFDDWVGVTDKPMFLAEYGTDAYRTLMFKVDPILQDLVSVDGAVDEDTQARWGRGLWREIASHLSAVNLTNVCLGGTVFEWCDEWWKAQAAFGGQVGRHDNLGFYTSWNPQGHPDSVANEEWFGQVSADRFPRQSYFNFQEDFAAVVLPPDLDGDGLPDSWEYALVDANSSDLLRDIRDVRPEDDFDHDGATNLEEYLAGTDPTDPASVLRLTASRSPATGQVTVRWTVAVAKAYELYYTDALSSTAWTLLPGNYVINGSEAEFVDATASTGGQRFYRLLVRSGPGG